MYVIFTGDRRERPGYLSLADEFLGGDGQSLDARVRMLYGDRDGDIISQYVGFTVAIVVYRSKRGIRNGK